MESAHIQAGNPASPEQAIQQLMKGNKEYSEDGRLKIASLTRQDWAKKRQELEHQKPWAVIWGCIDSRVPPEFVFNGELGELFVIRTAGQVSDSAALGSLEFVVKNWEHYPVKAVIVLGHSACGAVRATVDSLELPPPPRPAEGNIHVLVDSIKPAYTRTVEVLRSGTVPGNRVLASNHDNGEISRLCNDISKRNIAYQVRQLRASKILATAERDDKRITIMGAYYDLETGKVEMGIDIDTDMDMDKENQLT